GAGLRPAPRFGGDELPALWLTLSQWEPEPSPDAQGKVAADAVCCAAALALTPAAANHDGPSLRVYPGAERGMAGASVGSLIDFLTGPTSAARWVCPLDWEGRVELTVDRGPKEAVA